MSIGAGFTMRPGDAREGCEVMKADLTLDCMGMYCPMPIIKTATTIKELKVGQVLEVVADDPGIQSDIPAWCKTTGHECLGVEKSGSEFRAYVRRAK